jgi:5,10-methylenetetrahydrofolate reductase
MNSGKDMAGNELDGRIDFCIGTTGTPSADPLGPQLVKIEKKLKAGVDFIQTQAVYELDDLKRFTEFVRNVDEKARVLGGIVPVIGAKMAAYMNENVPGISIPQRLIDELAQAPKGTGVAKGIEIAARMIRQIKEEKICDGVHIMFIGREEKVPDILGAAGLL